MHRRVAATMGALAAILVLPLLAQPSAATPTGTTPEPTLLPAEDLPLGPAEAPSAGEGDHHVRFDPLATQRTSARQRAVQELLAGDAELVGKGKRRTIQLADGSEVDYPVTQTARLLSFLVEFGDGTSNPAFPDQTAGPLRNQIAEPADYDNSTYWKPDFDREHYLDMFFDGMPEQGEESFRDFYHELSSGRFDVEGDVSDWVTLPHPEAYYSEADGEESQAAMTAFIQDSADAWYDAEVAAGRTDAEIVAYLQSFDVWDRYDIDGDGVFDEPDGYIDHFQAIHAGEGEEAGAPPWTIWSHRWAANQAGLGVDGPKPTPECSACAPLGGVQIGTTGLWIRDYTTEPENGGLGVFAHEFGHDLGLPDLYDTTPGGGDNGTGHWSLMSAGSWLGHGDGAVGTTPGHLGPYEKLFLGWYGPGNRDLAIVDGLVAEPVDVTLGPSIHATNRGKQALAVLLPDGEALAHGPLSGDYLWSGTKDATVVQATTATSITVPGDDPTLHARVAYVIESGFDYAYLAVSTDGETWKYVPTSVSTNDDPNGANLGHGITGNSVGNTWQAITADLSAYQGQNVLLRWEYITDQSTHGPGILVDSLTLGDYSTEFSAVNDWTLAGFHSVIDGDYAFTYPRTYLAENRQYTGYDTTLATGPYSSGYALTQPGRVDHFPYQDGLLVWYLDGRYGDNNTTSHLGGGLSLPVDANPAIQVWWNAGGTSGYIADGRIQPYDATFDVDDTEPLRLTRETAGGPHTLDVPAHPSIPVFEDSDPNAYFDGTYTGSRLYSTRVAGAGTMIQVLSSDEEIGRMQVRVGKRFVAATSEPSLDGSASVGGTLTATPPEWFHSGVDTTVTWLRNGTPIGGATGLTYDLGLGDAGSSFAASFTGTKAGYTPTTVTTRTRSVPLLPAPTPTPPTAITGTAQVGDVLDASGASWPVTGSSSFAWSIDGTRVGTGTSYVVQPGDVGKQVTLTETFHSAGRHSATSSASTGPVQPGPAPTPDTPPAISGTARVGGTLTATGATWPIGGISSLTWSIDGTQVGTGTSYDVQPGDVGKQVTLTETFASPGYRDAVATAVSAAVEPAAPPVAETAPTLTGDVRVGGTLTVTGATWPLEGASSFTWSIRGETVGTGTTYTVRPRDARRRIVVTETFASLGHLDGVATVRARKVAKAPVSLTVRVGRAVADRPVAVHVTAQATVTVRGKLRIRYAGTARWVRLRQGEATLRLPARASGNHKLVVRYLGTKAFAKDKHVTRVRVRR